MKRTILSAAIVLASGSAQAIEIEIAAGPTGWGCTSCFGGYNNTDVAPGTTVTLISPPSGPLQTTFGTGTYTITNAETSGSYSAWNFEGYPDSPNWTWSYIIAADNGNGTATIVQTGGVNAIEPTQAQMAALTGTTTSSYQILLSGTSTAGFTNTLTLSSTTTLDFFIDDGYLPDNGGGVALNIQPVLTTPTPPPPAPSTVPEPTSFALLGTAFAGAILRQIKRSDR